MMHGRSILLLRRAAWQHWWLPQAGVTVVQPGAVRFSADRRGQTFAAARTGQQFSRDARGTVLQRDYHR